jgi:hypothetical protein
MNARYEKIKNLVEEGATVYFRTVYRVTVLTKKNLNLFTTNPKGSLLINGIDFSYTNITFTK